MQSVPRILATLRCRQLSHREPAFRCDSTNARPARRLGMTWMATRRFAAALTVAMAASAVQAVLAQDKSKPLFDRLGGVYNIATVVDDFIERLLVNDTLNGNPAIRDARTRVPKAGLKFHVTALVCEVTGGPCKYSGRSMKDAHAQLNINEAQWQAMVADFRKTLDKFKVPSNEQEELIAIVASTKKDIVQNGAGQD